MVFYRSPIAISSEEKHTCYKNYKLKNIKEKKIVPRRPLILVSQGKLFKIGGSAPSLGAESGKELQMLQRRPRQSFSSESSSSLSIKSFSD